MKRICDLQEWNASLNRWVRVCLVDDEAVADRWRRNKQGRLFTQEMCYSAEEFNQKAKDWYREEIKS